MPTDAVKAFNVAVAHREAGDYSTSVQAYQSAIAMEPRMAEAYLNVAFVLSELRRFVEAEHAYRHALGVRKWPAQTAAAASHNLGVLLDSLGRSSDATAAYKQALKYKPDFGPSLEILESAQDTTANAIEAGEPPTFVALINAGNEAFERGAHSDAERHYRLAVPLRDVRWEGAAYVGLGAALHGGGRLQEAKHVLMAGAKLNPSSPGMLSNLATVRSDLGEWKGAAGTWRRALALTPADAVRYSSAAASLQRGTRPADAIPFLRSAAALDPTNWQRHYAHAHACLKMAFLTGATAAGAGAATLDATPDAEDAAEAFEALRPLHRPPISLRMRAEAGAEPPWTRYDGRGLVGDEPPPLDSAALGRAQSTRRAEAARAGRQKGVIVYKLGPKSSELENLRLSLRLLTRFHNRKFRYPVLVAHDLEATASLSESLRAELRLLAQGAPLRFEQLDAHALPSWLPARSVPEKVLGFPIAYRHMIRWKAGLMWRMASLEQYEYIWLLDTDAFLLGPLTYDVFGLMAARNASYGYADVHGEDPSIVGGLSECVSKYVRARPSLNVASTIFGRGFRTRQGKWDGTKFYTNFQVARRDFGNSAGYRDLFDFIDRDGGIYRHRWGADPILFLAVTLLLDETRIVHFDDVPYLHQHLVANLPARPPDAIDAAAAEDCVAEEAEAIDAAAAAVAGSSGPTLAGVLLFISDAAHAAAAVDSLQRHHTRQLASWAREQPHCRGLVVQPCVTDGFAPDEMAIITTHLKAMPDGMSALPLQRCAALAGHRAALATGSAPVAQGTQAALEALAGLPQEKAAEAEAAATVLHVASWLRAAAIPQRLLSTPLLLLCVDDADPRTMAAMLGARVSKAHAINVCDVPALDGGNSPLPSLRVGPAHPALSAEADYLLGAAAGCLQNNATNT